MSIAELLDGSRAAHLRYRDNVTRRIGDGTGSTVVVEGNAEAASMALIEACRLRAEAHVLDPQRMDPAWLDQPIRYNHDEVLDFYVEQLSR